MLRNIVYYKHTLFPSVTRGKCTGKVPIPHRYTIDCICDCNLSEFAYAGSIEEGRTVWNMFL